ncbi:hypothetical protein AV530_005329 [Patagioenas fasciata monilis]|uniref:Uncharacterized protein n=1 Tax=Patagioenas fasciata monilis TaxID=372326 RepID=A0A1V4JLB2_PATFA|nr:hypothetical protein AV530_005329 [Patagioenas fasciata monilis]
MSSWDLHVIKLRRVAFDERLHTQEGKEPRVRNMRMSEENQKWKLFYRIGHWSRNKTVMAETCVPSNLLKKGHSATRNSRFVELEATSSALSL